MAKKFLQHAIKHPGALTAAAHSHGVSKHAEAVKESHSSNPHVRGRGLLGLRLMKGGDLYGGSTHLASDSMKAEAMRGRSQNAAIKRDFATNLHYACHEE